MAKYTVTMKTEVFYDIEVEAATFGDAADTAENNVFLISDIEQVVTSAVTPLVNDNMLVDLETTVTGINKL